MVDQRLAGHDHAGGVHAPLPLEVLEAARGVDHARDVGVGTEVAELGGLVVPLVVLVEDAPSEMSLAMIGGGITLVIRSPIAYG